jgi:hypothetical protein
MQKSQIENVSTTKAHMKKDDCLKDLICQCDGVFKKLCDLENDLGYSKKGLNDKIKHAM